MNFPWVPRSWSPRWSEALGGSEVLGVPGILEFLSVPSSCESRGSQGFRGSREWVPLFYHAVLQLSIDASRLPNTIKTIVHNWLLTSAVKLKRDRASMKSNFSLKNTAMFSEEKLQLIQTFLSLLRILWREY